MSLVLQVKRAAKDKGLYNGETDSLNWEPSHVIMYNRLCNRFGGHFTNEPSRANQNPDFLEFIDKYKDAEYTEGRTEEPKPLEGARLKDFVPDPLPVNQEGAKNKDEVKQRQEMVNGNVVKVATKPPVTEPAKVVDNANKNKEVAPNPINTNTNKESTNEKTATGSADDSANVGSANGTQSSNEGKTGEETTGEGSKESTDNGTSNTQSNTASTGTPAPTVAPKTESQPKPSTNAQAKSGSTVKVR